jgi:hypothetical protein
MSLTNTDCVREEVYFKMEMQMKSIVNRMIDARPKYKYLYFHMHRHEAYSQVHPQIYPIRKTISQELNDEFH